MARVQRELDSGHTQRLAFGDIDAVAPCLSVEHLVPPDHSQADMAFTPYAPFAGGTYVIECKGASINVGLPTPGAANITVLFPGGQSHALLAAGE